MQVQSISARLVCSVTWHFEPTLDNLKLCNFQVIDELHTRNCVLQSQCLPARHRHVWWCYRAVVVRWHSFQRGSARPDSYLFRTVESGRGTLQGSRPMASLSCGQLLVLRKLALLKLTAFMERYCPTHRTGWNWELPKFIRKIKTPDYKGEMRMYRWMNEWISGP